MYTASLAVILAASSGFYSDQRPLEGKEPESILSTCVLPMYRNNRLCYGTEHIWYH